MLASKVFVACDEIVLISGARRKQIFVSYMLVLPRIKPEVLRDFVFSPDTPAGDGSGIQEDSNALGGGSGWTILSYNLYTGEVHNYRAWDHRHNTPMGYSLLVLDMY